MYRFARRTPGTYDAIDPRLIRDEVAPAVEELQGRTTDHNWVAGTFAAGRRSNAMLYDFHTASLAVDHHTGSNANSVPDALDANSFLISDTGEWQAIPSASVTYASGEDTCWAIGWAQYGTATGSASLNTSVGSVINKPRIQFAIRIDGAISEASITGTDNPAEGAPVSVYPVSPITTIKADWASIDTRTIPGTGANGFHVRCDRTQTVEPTSQGNVTVELVARRVPATDYPGQGSTSDPVYVYSRKLIAIQMKSSPTDAGTGGQTVSVDFPVDGDTFNAASFTTNILDPIKTAVDDLGEGAIRRHGLRKEHLPTGGILSQSLSSTLTTGDTSTIDYPGYGSTGTPGGGAGQWDTVDDGVGNELEINGAFDFTTVPAFVLILANVSMTGVLSSVTNEPRSYGVFSLSYRYTTSGTYVMDASTEGWANNPNIQADSAGSVTQEACYADVPLLQWYDWRTAPPAGGTIDKFLAICTRSINPSGTLYFDNSSMFALIFRP